jgi:phage terminase large subunit GpA-like protein
MANTPSPSPNRAPSPRKRIEVADPAVADFLKEEFLSLFRPREFLQPAEWQEKYRVAPPGSPKAGRWRNWPYQVEPFNSFNDSTISSLCLDWASQVLGKSAVLEGGLLWMIHQNPGTCVIVFPTQDNAGHWSKNRFSTQVASCSAVRELIRESFTRTGKAFGEGGNTILHKLFKGGWIILGGANSPANLASHTARWQLFDEVDKYPPSSGEEGDVVLLTQQRGARYSDSFSVLTSTPTLADMSRIEKEIQGTDYRKWFVACPGCNEEFVIMWAHVRWPKEENEKGEKIHRIDEAYVVCPYCEAKIDEAARIKIVTAGRWVATQPHITSKRGYWANALIALGPAKRGFKSWLHYFAQRFFDAERLGPEGQKTFQNLVLAETWQIETTPPPDFENLYARRELYPEYEGEIVIPEKVLLLTVGADVQSDRIEAEILGFGISEESWGIDYKIFRGDTELPDIFNAFDEWVRKKWRHASGHLMWPAAVAIDSSNKPTQPYAYVRRCRREYVAAIKGDRGYTAHWVQRSGSKKPLYILKVDGPKERLYSQLRLVDPGPGYQHFPANPSAGYDLVYFQQLTAEKMVHGSSAPYFVKIHSKANEALDARVYALAAREFLPGVNYPKIAAGLAVAPESDWRPTAKPPPPEPEPSPPGAVPVNAKTPLIKPKVRRAGRGTGWASAF